MMSRPVAVSSIVISLGLAACSTPQEQAAEAQAEYTEEKTATLEEYKECVKDAEGDEGALKGCDALLKAVDAVEGGVKQ